MNKLPLSEADLQAWVDGRLPESRRAEVEDYLAAQPGEAGRLNAYREQRDALRQHFDPVLDETLPARLHQLAEHAPAAVDRQKRPLLEWLL